MSELIELDELLAPSVTTAEEVSYRGSLDYIDSLPTSPVVSFNPSWYVLGRETDVFSNDVVEIPNSLPRDNRRFNFNTDFDPGEITPGSSRIYDRIATPEEPYTEKEKRRIEATPGYKKANRRPFKRSVGRLTFNDPRRLKICIDRKIRREIMHAFGLAGLFYPPIRFGPYSRISCYGII